MILGICANSVETFKLIGLFIYLAKILVPLLIIILGIKDVAIVVVKGDTEGIRNGLGSLFRRLASGLIIFLVPTMIPNVIKMLVDDYENSDTARCSTCLFSPFKGECDNYIKEYRDSRKPMEFDDIYIFGTDFDTSSLDDVPGDIRDEYYKTDKGSYSSDV